MKTIKDIISESSNDSMKRLELNDSNKKELVELSKLVDTYNYDNDNKKADSLELGDLCIFSDGEDNALFGIITGKDTIFNRCMIAIDSSEIESGKCLYKRVPFKDIKVIRNKEAFKNLEINNLKFKRK